jgi:hypothetical protein
MTRKEKCMKLGMKCTLAGLVLWIVTAGVVLSQQQRPRAEAAPRVVPPATEEMQRAEFWISRIQNPDRVIMTPVQIDELNKKNHSRPYDLKDVNGNPFSFLSTIINKDNTIGLQFYLENPLALKSFPSDSLRVRLERHRKSFNLANMYDRRQVRLDPDQVREIDERINMNGIPDKIVPQYGILVAHTLNRALPTNEAIYGGPGGWTDPIQSTALDMCMPVAVLHSSPNRDWYYVRSEIAFGWVPAVNVAFGSPKAIGDYVNAKDFIVATEHKVPVFADRAFASFITDFYMGARLKLTKKSQTGYQVVVPVRKPGGDCEFITGWVRPDARVSVGYQSYTQRNILNTIFTLLYRPYGWADERYERDCCGTQRVVLRTFGIFTGRWTTMELHSSDHVYAFPRDTTKEEKYKYLDTCEPAITLMGDPGHVIMYLGKVDGKYYVIHQSGYFYTDSEGVQRFVGRVNVNDTELEGGSNVNSLTEITEIKP